MNLPTEIGGDSAMPSSPGDLGRVHVAATAHVAVGCLATTMGATAGNTGNTGNSAPSTPGLGRGHHAGELVDAVGLTVVLVHVAVDVVDDVATDGSSEDCGEREGLAGLLTGESVELGDKRSGSCHFFFS